MKIGELARRSGLAHSRIRFYESIGLLKTVERRPNGYRSYPPEAVQVLDLIASAQKAGFSLDEIRALMPADLEQWEHGSLIEALRRKVEEIGALEARLAQSKAHLVALLAEIEAKPGEIEAKPGEIEAKPGEIEAKPGEIDCAANARRVLSRMQHGEIGSPAMAAGDLRLLGKASRRRPVGAG